MRDGSRLEGLRGDEAVDAFSVAEEDMSFGVLPERQHEGTMLVDDHLIRDLVSGRGQREATDVLALERPDQQRAFRGRPSPQSTQNTAPVGATISSYRWAGPTIASPLTLVSGQPDSGPQP